MNTAGEFGQLERGVVEKALRIALAAHAGQTRKSDPVPFVMHPVMVAMKLAQHGFPEPVLAAALLHDVVEDTTVTLDELREQMGDEIAQIVYEVTEDKSLPWQAQKEGYIDMVRNGSVHAKAVSVSDKIHNSECTLYTYGEIGPELWKSFNSRDQQVWFMEAMLAMFKETWQHPLVDEFETLVVKLRQLE